jgi:hypothetical protein
MPIWADDWRSFMICTSQQILFWWEIKNNEIGGACGTYGGEELHTGIWWRDLGERDHMEDLGVDRRVILKCIFKK